MFKKIFGKKVNSKVEMNSMDKRIAKEIFHSARHKKIIKEAAKNSSLEQKKFVESYNKMSSC